MLIAQISDTHISADAPERTADLECSVAQINALVPRPDVVVHTGDVSHDGLPAQYEIARAALSTLEMPWYVMVGNRDRREALRACFAAESRASTTTEFIQYAVDDFPVRLVCADTLSMSSNKGHMCADRRAELKDLLEAGNGKPAAVFMHHPPFEVPVAPDPMQFIEAATAAECRDILTGAHATCGLFCGHVHRPFETRIDAVPARVMTAVARDLRFGEARPIPADVPRYVLHQIEERV